MSMPWFRLYAEFAGDPVVQSLAFEDQRHYIVLLCLKCGGLLDRVIAPTTRREQIIARGLGLDLASASEAKRRLQEVGLIDKNWQPMAWDKRQFTSDVSTNRVRKYRERKENGNVTETDLERFGNAPDTEQIQNRAEQKTTLASSDKISLSADGHWQNISPAQRNAWGRAYPALSLDAELARAASWILANPQNRKKNYARFLTNWLSRAQDKAPRVNAGQSPKPGKMQRAIDALRRSHGTATDAPAALDSGAGTAANAGAPARLRTDS